MAPPRPTTDGSYGKNVRNWGENVERSPEDCVLTPPRRAVSNAGGFESRIQSTLIKAPPPDNTEKKTKVKSVKKSDTSSRLLFWKKTTPDSKSKRRGNTESTIQGRTTIRLSVLPVGGNTKVRISAATGGIITPEQDFHSFTPHSLLDIENGTSILVTKQQFLDHHRFQELGRDGAIVVTAKATGPVAKEDCIFFNERGGQSLQERIRSGDITDLHINAERGILGGAWRGIMRKLLLLTLDETNGLRLGRQLQLFLPFLTGLEAYILSQVIEALDGKKTHLLRKANVEYALKIAFLNRNVSRIIVQNIGPRWDYLFHWDQAVTNLRLYDVFSQIPILGNITSFPATENFPDTRDHAVASTFRILFGKGNWITRVLTQNRQGLNTDDPDKNIAQNLAAESNGFELANRNQYGTYIGRLKTNQFRVDNRLPADESIVRTFVAQPMPTLVNNGVVHTLRQLAKHWHNVIVQLSGNFSHQRMEQLDPFETMRLHMPVVCIVLASLRGRNKWDSMVLGPFIRKCQELKASFTADGCRYLVREMQENIVVNLCGGIAAVVDPLRSWLDAIHQACDLIQEEAKIVYEKVTGVEVGLRLGHDLMTQVTWKIPKHTVLQKAILDHIRGEKPQTVINERRVRAALALTTPRDKRTLMELVKNNLTSTKPAKMLLGRVKTLLQREIRREAFNEAIRELSMGEYITEFVHDEWYWFEEREKNAVYIYDAKVTGKDVHRFIHVDSGTERFVSLSDGHVKCRAYVPVAEAICRAQRCYMEIELDHGKKFKYNAFMEFSYLRISLRRLAVISQVFCEELDNARLHVLREIQRSNQVQVAVSDMAVGKVYYYYHSKRNSYEPFVCDKEYTPADPEWTKLARKKIVKVPPQSVIVVGGGPAGLMAVIHCTESVLVTGGEMKLYEARDAFSTGGSTFERAQIVRLDARWIAMLRYHLGTGFEDIYIPASGETDAQLGNTLPTQGFVEITIKDLENMLHVEVSRLWSKGVVQCYTDSKAQYDATSNSLTKQGDALKTDDMILRRVDPDGNPSKDYYSWRIANLIYQQPLGLDDLKVGREYGVYVRVENAVFPFKLTGVELQTRTYTFKPLKEDMEELKATAHNLPSVYPKGTTRHAGVEKIVVESIQKGSSGGRIQEELPMRRVRKEKFALDIGNTHIIECIGKPHDSKAHFSVTTYEPYAVCCIQGLKISMGMHNFGEKRWGSGLLDDFRSTNDQNTRIIGDFTKMVRQRKIAERMEDLVNTENWQEHFKTVVADSKLSGLDDLDPLLPKLLEGVKWHAENAKKFKRQTLQTRFFETGDNYYLGMELTREYDKWKNELAEQLTESLGLNTKDHVKEKEVKKFQGVLMHHIDRLWYEACLEIIRAGDVYNPGARHRVPHIWLTKSYFDQKLGTLPIGESFRLAGRPEGRYEVMIKQRKQIIVRNVEGKISKMKKDTLVRREGDLTRSPDGNQESRVSLATFPVGHYINFRTVRLNNESRGYVLTFVGDEQATPHFMRYSGLTGACINAMLFNNFIKSSIEGGNFIDRFQLYSKETNWSNGEVVQRGTSSNYGEDGFLRPGFPYHHAIDYLHSKVIEYMETQQDLDDIISRDWKKKFAASMIPRGMELNENFIRVLYEKMQMHIFNKFVSEVDKNLSDDALTGQLVKRQKDMSERLSGINPGEYWAEFLSGLDGLDKESRQQLADFHCEVAKCLEQTVIQIVEFASKGYLYNERVNQELHNQPKPVDSIVDDFAVEAQNFANSLVMSAAFSAGALAFVLVDIRQENATRVGEIWAAIIAALNILISFGTMTNAARYKIRNEEARIIFFSEKFSRVKKAVFSLMDKKSQDKVPTNENPFKLDLEEKVQKFLYDVEYYNIDEAQEFNFAYKTMLSDINNPAKIRHFQKKLSGYFIADLYHVNSYVQESLVDIYKVCEDMHSFLTQELGDKRSASDKAWRLFDRLVDFTPTLDRSLQRGNVSWGFLKKRRIAHWDIFVVIRYFYSLICCACTRCKTPLSPIQTETLGVLKGTRDLSAHHSHTVLRREIRDLEYLYWATHESDVASLIFVSALLIFLVSWIFTISRIITAFGGPSVVTDVAFWATLASAFGAILAAFHFQRKFFILIRLECILGTKLRRAASSNDKGAIRAVKRVTSTQIFLTLTRLLTAYAAAVALPFAVVIYFYGAFGEKIRIDESIPFWIALGAVCAAVCATIFFFVVEYIVRYNLSPKLGEYICEAFRDEIQDMYTVLSVPNNDIDTKQVQERETWEYVAREFLHKYRFDTVFAADRFGSILQYLQSGMDPRN